MSRRYPQIILTDMLTAIKDIQTYRSGMSAEDLLASSLHQDAIIRKLEVLGEAANQLAPDIQALAPDIPWSKIISLRNRLIHEYHGVNWEVLMPIVFNNLSPLTQQLETLKAIVSNVIHTNK